MTTLNDWLEVRNGYVAVRHIVALTPIQVAGGWQVRVTTVDGTQHHLFDTEATREEARATALRTARIIAGEALEKSDRLREAEARFEADRLPNGMRPSEYAMTLAAEARDLRKVHALAADGKTPRQIIKATGLSPAKVTEYLAIPTDEEVTS
jgi:hypothetical protein